MKQNIPLICRNNIDIDFCNECKKYKLNLGDIDYEIDHNTASFISEELIKCLNEEETILDRELLVEEKDGYIHIVLFEKRWALEVEDAIWLSRKLNTLVQLNVNAKKTKFKKKGKKFKTAKTTKSLKEEPAITFNDDDDINVVCSRHGKCTVKVRDNVNGKFCPECNKERKLLN